jgi:ABC-type Fe3+-siderophore transport system permease subunit
MLPLNAVTALIGAPVVVLVLLRSRRGKVLI